MDTITKKSSFYSFHLLKAAPAGSNLLKVKGTQALELLADLLFITASRNESVCSTYERVTTNLLNFIRKTRDQVVLVTILLL